jgi:uncharacterized membrane protein YhiD involved in acid resistance
VIEMETALPRLVVAMLLGAILGIEREWRHKTAGVKTNTLVALGACGFALISDTFGPGNHNPAQIAAAVVTGIGFIGAGVIIHRGATIQGVTTAATLWANASMGVAVGIGEFLVGTAVFIGVIFSQIVMRQVERLVNRVRPDPQSVRMELSATCDDFALRSIDQAWSAWASEAKVRPLRKTMTRIADHVAWRALFATSEKGELDLSILQERILALDGVRQVEARRLSAIDV